MSSSSGPHESIGTSIDVATVIENAELELSSTPTDLQRSFSMNMATSCSDSSSDHEDDISFTMHDNSVYLEAPPEEAPKMHDVDLKDEIKEMEALLEPNAPHPSLEYPPLYFGLKRFFPQQMEKAKKCYQWRWSLSYPLQKRVKGSKLLRYLRIYLTYGEILLLLPLLALAVWCVVVLILNPSVTDSGKASRLAVVAALLFAQKNSYLTMLLGVPFDRAVLYHSISGYIAVVTGLLHGVACMLNATGTVASVESWKMLGQGSMNISGTCILGFMILIYLTALPVVRRRLHQFFYYCHMVLLVGIIGGTAAHTGIMVPLTIFFTTGIDLLVRKVYMARFRYPNKASLTLVSDTVVEVSFPKTKGFDYNPGQYIYIAVPELSSFEWHPFSISTAPHQNKVTLHIRIAGDWTSALHALAHKKKQVDILMEGPYGNFGVDVMSETRYKCVLLLSGGVGLGPMQSMFSHLLHEQMSGDRTMKKLKFVWVQRDPELMAHAAITDTSADLHASKSMFTLPDEYDTESARQDLTEGNCTSLATMILGGIPAGKETDQELEEQYNSFDLLDQPVSVHNPLPWPNASSKPTTKTNEDSATDMEMSGDLEMSGDCSILPESDKKKVEAPVLSQLGDVLDIDIFLTSETDTHMPFVKRGRPDLAALFVQMRNEAQRMGEKRVAVCVCGPKRISFLSRKACIQLSDSTVRFDYHEESFGG